MPSKRLSLLAQKPRLIVQNVVRVAEKLIVAT
jgi:hypothetical protein